MKFDDLKKVLKRYECQLTQCRKATHWKVSRFLGGQTLIYIFAVHGNEVKGPYIHKIRKSMKLLPADGVSDDAFYR